MSKGILISMGSNMGDRIGFLNHGCDALTEAGIKILKRSSVYETEPWGGVSGGSFYNAVIRVSTTLSPRNLMITLLEIESSLGRMRSNGPLPDERTLDLDLLFYHEKVIDEHLLVLPHPRLHLRSFVLVPLVEIAHDFTHPLLNKSIEELYRKNADEGEVTRLTDQQWRLLEG